MRPLRWEAGISAPGGNRSRASAAAPGQRVLGCGDPAVRIHKCLRSTSPLAHSALDRCAQSGIEPCNLRGLRQHTGTRTAGP